jgi:hypothetical protein
VYGLDLLKSLFTPTQGFEMMDNAKFERYKKENARDSGTQTPTIKLGMACWRWLAQHDDIEGRPWCKDMLSVDILDELDRSIQIYCLNHVKVAFLNTSDAWETGFDNYREDVVEIINRVIVLQMWQDTDQQTVRDQILRKLEWIFLDHGFHYARPIPLMTTSTIKALVETFERVPNAISEVSVWPPILGIFADGNESISDGVTDWQLLYSRMELFPFVNG